MILKQITLVVVRLLLIYRYFIFLRAILSWINIEVLYPIKQFFYTVTEPLLRPIRALLSRFITGPMDFSPIVAYFLIEIVSIILLKSIR